MSLENYPYAGYELALHELDTEPVTEPSSDVDTKALRRVQAEQEAREQRLALLETNQE